MADVKLRAGEKSGSAKSAVRRRETLSRRRAVADGASEARLPFGPRNWQFIGAGLVAIVIGFIALSRGSMTLAPFLLVGGYCVLIPVGLLVSGRKELAATDSAPSAGE